jgi:hypothetical protein
MKYIFLLLVIINTTLYAKPYKVANIHKIKKAILTLKNIDNADQLAIHIKDSSDYFKVDPRLFVILMYVESGFDNNAVSETNDISIAQISMYHWKNNPRLKKTGKFINKIDKNEALAIYVMGEILSILQKDHSKDDPHWFLRYHSNTLKFKDKYFRKVKSAFLKIKGII